MIVKFEINCLVIVINNCKLLSKNCRQQTSVESFFFKYSKVIYEDSKVDDGIIK